MNKRILYPTDEGVAVIVPADCGLSIEEIAAKDVPSGGTPYWIVDVNDIPSDRLFRSAWVVDRTVPPSGVK